MARTITAEETEVVHELVGRARAAMAAIEHYDQATVDRICRAVGWAGGNLDTATRLANMSVDESGMGRREPTRRAKVQGILRDALRQKSMGVIEEDAARGLVKYAKPAGVIAALIPVTSPYVTPVGIAIYAIKCKDAVIFSPHPSSRKTTIETVRMMRAALAKQGAPEDILQVVERPSIPAANELMAKCDLTIATGGPAMVKAAYGSGKPAYGVGAGNATMVIDETANVEEKAKLQTAYWDAEGRRTADTIARDAAVIAKKAGIDLPDGKTFLIVPERLIGKAHPFSTEKLGVVLSIFKYHGWEMALDMVRRIFETGGRGHSCG